jgi:hypothetical protein
VTRREAAATRGALFLILGLVLIATGRSLGNGFAFDDIPIILENAQVHAGSAPWVYALQSYWPPATLGDAYRPWTVWWFSLQWLAGGGAPWVFHLTSLLLTAAVALLVFLLARELMPLPGAAAAAALFAVHPAPVEATGNVVGQGELWMALFVVAGGLLYLRSRRRGILGGRHRVALGLLLVLAAASKEQGIVLPGLLVAAEWLAVPRRPGESRIRILWPTLAFLAVVAVGFLAGRYAVLGDLGGGPPAAGLEGLDAAGRTAVMLPMVLDWGRLLLWPARLLAQYSPPAYGSPPDLTAAVLGGTALLGAAVAGWALRDRAPIVAFGLAWVAVSLLPVSNIPFPTGVLIAERTLFLPSAGLALSAGAVFVAAMGRRNASGFAAAALLLLTGLGAARSFSRQAVWRDNPTLLTQTVIDEPRSYRAFFGAGRDLARRGRPDDAAAMYARAAALWSGDHRVFEEWGQVLRTQGRCADAIPILERGVRVDPHATLPRSRLFECLLAVGRVDQAIAVAKTGLDLGRPEFEASLERARTRLPPPGPLPATR